MPMVRSYKLKCVLLANFSKCERLHKMSPEQATALIVAVSGLIGALGVVFAQLRQTHGLINSRMTELIDTTKLAAQLGGQQEGVEQERARLGAIQAESGQTDSPTR